MNLTVPRKPEKPYAELWVFVSGYWPDTNGPKQYFWYPVPAKLVEHYQGMRTVVGTTDIVNEVVTVIWHSDFGNDERWKDSITKQIAGLDPHPTECISEWPS